MNWYLFLPLLLYCHMMLVVIKVLEISYFVTV